MRQANRNSSSKRVLQNRRTSRTRRIRLLDVELLEPRRLLATLSSGDLKLDVNEDGQVSPLDALIVINALNAAASNGNGVSTAGRLDVDQDGAVTPVDAVLVMNRLNGEIVDQVIPQSFSRPVRVQAQHGLLIGDYDLDCVVDDDDYALLVSDFGSTTNLAADGNGNGIVDAADITLWRDFRGTHQCNANNTAIWSLRNREYGDRDLHVDAVGNVDLALKGGSHAQWQVVFTPGANNRISLQNVDSGEYLAGSMEQAFTTPNAGSETEWEIVDHADGAISLKNVATGMFLDGDAAIDGWDVRMSNDTLADARWNAAVWTSPSTPSVSFAMIGDYGTDGVASRRVAGHIQQAEPDFILAAGDARYGGQSYDSANGRFCDYLSDVQFGGNCLTSGSSTPNRFFAAPGNHDYTDGEGIEGFVNYFDFPGRGAATSDTSNSELYYDVVLGPVHVFVLDSQALITLDEGGYQAQTAWLQAGLAASTTPWQIVLLHHSPFSSANHGSDPIVQLNYANWGVDLVLSGHDHTYERIERDGTTFIVNGLGGAVLYSLRDPIEGSQVGYDEQNGALYMDATATSLQGTFVDVDGDVIDSFSVQPTVGGQPEIIHDLTVTGTVFFDANMSQFLEAGEMGIPDVVVFVDENLNFMRDPGETFTTTDMNGVYDLDFGGPRNYWVVVETPPEYEPTINPFRFLFVIGPAPLVADFGFVSAVV